MSQKNVPVLGADVSTLTNEQIVSWYGKHPHATVRSLVSRIQWLLDQHSRERTAAYAEGFTAQQAVADRVQHHLLSKLSPEELQYLEV
jgi:hypothetical protein